MTPEGSRQSDMNTPGIEQHPLEDRNDSVITRTIAGRINSWSSSAERLYGWRKEEAIGKVSHELLKTQFPRPLEEIEFELARGGRWEGPLVHTTRDGGRVVVESRWILEPHGEFGTVVESNKLRQEPVSPNSTVDFLTKIATIVLVAGFLSCLIVLLYSLYRYHWTADEFPSTFVIVVYHLFPAVLAGLLLASLWLPPLLRINVAMLLFATGATIYVVETAATIWVSLPSEAAKQEIVARVQAAQEWGVEFDRRTKLEVVTDLRKKGVDAYPSIPAQELLKAHAVGAGLLPLGGISNKVTVLCNESGDYTIYESDEHGFHNPKGIWTARVDIAALGDSNVQGQCVASENNFVALIRNRYPGTLNLGVGGHGPLMMLATMKEYLRFVKPGVVLWFHYEGNDLLDLRRERSDSSLMRYLTDGFAQGLLKRQTEIDHLLTQYVESEMRRGEFSKMLEELSEEVWPPERLLENVAGAVKLRHVRRALGLIDGRVRTDAQSGYRTGDYTGEVRDLFPQVMSQVKAVASEWGGKLYFVYLPEWSTKPEIVRDDKQQVLSVVRNLGIPIIDVQRAFRTHDDPKSLFPFRMVGHYNEAGYRLVADEVLRNLERFSAGSRRSEAGIPFQEGPHNSSPGPGPIAAH